jgi:acyl-CoA synthetase (AMP-forming)/AMP-acid ligase II
VICDFDAEALTKDVAVPGSGPQGTRRLVSSGRPVTLDVRIVDPETRAERPEGRVGEIWVGGGSVARGYWGGPEESRMTFGARTIAGDGPYLRTGDLGFILAGELFVTGRIKDLIIVNGRNIHAHDIEEAARAAHPAALIGAAFAIDGAIDADVGGGLDGGREHVVLVQEISTRAAAGTPLDELAALIKARVARAFELPAVSVVLAARGTVRRTTSGKMQRRLTREAFLTGEITALADDLESDVADLRRAPA